MSMIRIGLATLLGIGTGVTFERHRKDFDWFWQVEAAKTIADSKLSAQNKSVVSGEQEKPTGTSGISGRVAEIAKYGFPSYDSIRSHDNFVLSYDRRNRNANWVLEHIKLEHIDGQSVDRSSVEFFEDQSIHPYFRATNADFKGSGYDRGHLAAAGNHRTDHKLIAQTFVLSNISPQVGKGFNRGAWNRLEKYCRWRAKRVDNLYVCTGPLYLPRKEADGKTYVKYEVIGRNNVAVPTHFFKVLLIQWNDELHLEAFVMPNKPIDDNVSLDSFRVPIDTIERGTGLLFFNTAAKEKIKSINGRSL